LGEGDGDGDSEKEADGDSDSVGSAGRCFESDSAKDKPDVSASTMVDKSTGVSERMSITATSFFGPSNFISSLLSLLILLLPALFPSVIERRTKSREEEDAEISFPEP
jgi:hypothetical protein